MTAIQRTEAAEGGTGGALAPPTFYPKKNS